MKRTFKLLAVFIFSTAFFAFACQSNGEPSKPLNFTEKQTYKAVGVVKNLDADAGKITIDSEEIAGYMPAMEMTAPVGDAKTLESVRPGDKVEFELERTGSGLLITALKKIGTVALAGGGEIYKTNCSTCHGGLGEGAAKGISLLKGHALKHSESEYIEQVSNGEGKKMPAFKDKLSAEQIAAVVKFVREELQKSVPKEDSAEHQH
jgi:mono/diheme cytochrome c family protein